MLWYCKEICLSVCLSCSTTFLFEYFDLQMFASCDEQVRQYFIDESFYANDVSERGLCGDLVNATNAFVCEGFAPSAATVKVMFTVCFDITLPQIDAHGWWQRLSCWRSFIALHFFCRV